MNNIFGEDAIVPKVIPFYLKEIKVKSLNHTASVIAIYVGKLHYKFMYTLITKAPFEEIELVPLAARRNDKDMFDQRVQLHNFLCQDSGAFKLHNTSYDFQDRIKTDRWNDEKVKDNNIDIAEAASTQQEGTLYIQYMLPHKESVMQ